MCGRYVLRSNFVTTAEMFAPLPSGQSKPRYNIAPTQDVPVIRASAAGHEVVKMRWGLIPSWAKDSGIGSKLINARGETLAEKPAFRAAFRSRRCIVPADGFYEWRKSGTRKDPYFIGLKNDEPFGFAGLWDAWRDSFGAAVESFTIVTTKANELVGQLHDRMPVILDRSACDLWLNPDATPEQLAELIKPFPVERMISYPVSNAVNKVANESPTLIQRIEGESGLFGAD